MMNYQKGDLVLIAFPFASGGKSKRRPALVVLDTGDADVVVARITSQAPPSAMDVALHQWRAAGLRAASVVRLHKLATLEKSLVVRPLGSLHAVDRRAVAACLQQTFSNW